MNQVCYASQVSYADQASYADFIPDACIHGTWTNAAMVAYPAACSAVTKQLIENRGQDAVRIVRNWAGFEIDACILEEQG